MVSQPGPIKKSLATETASVGVSVALCYISRGLLVYHRATLTPSDTDAISIASECHI